MKGAFNAKPDFIDEHLDTQVVRKFIKKGRADTLTQTCLPGNAEAFRGQRYHCTVETSVKEAF